MANITSFNVDYWSEPDEQGRVTHIGMVGKQELFRKLNAHLESKNMVPDEYFLAGDYIWNEEEELPNYDEALCIPRFGDSEGIYLDISLVYQKDGERRYMPFATGKTLDESADAFLKMSRVAAECSLLLNGRGSQYKKSFAEVTLQPDEALYLTTLLERETIKCRDEDDKKLLMNIKDQLFLTRFESVIALGRREPEIFSLWIHNMSDIRLEYCISYSAVYRGCLEDILKLVPVCNEENLYLLQRDKEAGYILYICYVGKEYFSVHKQEGCWRFGTKEEILAEINERLG